MSSEEKKFADSIIDTNEFDPSDWKNASRSIKRVLDFYLMKREDIPLADNAKKEKAIKKFENSCYRQITDVCNTLLYE